MDAKATLPLTRALADLSAGFRRAQATEKPERLAARTAMRVYATGRLALLRGDLKRALDDLQSATRLDPGAVEPWEAYGEAQLRSGQLRGAADSFDRAVALGSTDPAVVLAVAREALERDDHRKAGQVLAVFSASPSVFADPALPYVTAAMLGRSLLTDGYVAAGREAIAAATDLPEAFNRPTRYREELADVYRRRADLWRSIGDADCRLGEFDAAADAYRRAGGYPALDQSATLPRLVYALLAAGRPTAAADAIIDDIQSEGARIEERHIPLVGYVVRAAPETAGALEMALQREAGAAAEAESLAGVRARALAAAAGVASPERARGILARRLESSPDDVQTARSLVETYAGVPPAAAAEALRGLADRCPGAAPALAEQVAREGPERARAILAAAVPAQTHTGGLFVAVLALRCGELERAAAALASARPGAADSLAAVGASMGSWVLVDKFVRDAHGPWERARALAGPQRYDEAWQAVEAGLRQGLPSARDLRFAGNLALSTARPAEAADLLRRAIEADPYVDGPYLALIRQYGEGGALADRARLGEVVRRLQDANGSGRGLGMLRAEEWAANGRFADAEAALLDLAQEDPWDEAPFRALFQVWAAMYGRRGGAEPARLDHTTRRVGDIAALQPNSPWPRLALAQLTSRSDPDKAVADLDIAAGTSLPEEAAALGSGAEQLLRGLGRVTEANERALQRLRAAPLTIDATVALAAQLARQGKTDEAAGALATRLPVGAVLNAGQTGLLADAVVDRARSKPKDAVTLARALAMAGVRDVSMYRLWAQAIGLGGTASDATSFVEECEKAGMTEAVLKALLTPARLSESKLNQAELAYTMGGLLASRGSDADAVSLNELAVRLDPDHAMAANDLGYTLLEQGRDLDRAERLLERAHTLRPDDANITDSIGWLRYKRGILADQPGRSGAVSLLKRAAELQDAGGDGTIIDHYGDALWAAGERDEAARQWRAAGKKASDLLSQVVARGVTESPAVQRLKALIESTRTKQQAVLRGTDPPIAPMLTPPPPAPAPTGSERPAGTEDGNRPPDPAAAPETEPSPRIR